jgi:Tol biopolymer transport system component
MIAAGGVGSEELSPDSRWVVFAADALVDERVELFSAPLDGSAPAQRLSGDLAPGVQGSGVPFAIVSDSARVVYLRFESGWRGLLSAPIDGSAPALPLGTPLPVGREIAAFLPTPDATRVVFTADLEVNDRHELYVVPLDGSAPPLKLSTVPPHAFVVTRPAVSPDSTRAVYLADGLSNDVIELFSVPLDGSLPPVRLNGSLIASADVDGFRISPDSARVVYESDQLALGQRDLFSAPSDGSAPAVRLNDDGSRPVSPYAISADSTRVLWNPGSTDAFFSAPIATAGAVLDLGSSHPVDGFVLGPDGARVIFGRPVGGVLEQLWSGVPDGSLAPVELTASTGPGFVALASFTPDATRVVFLHGSSGLGPADLRVAPADGSGPARLIASGASDHQVEHLAFSDDVGFFVADGLHPPLWRVPLDGSSPPALVHAPPLNCARGNVTDARLGADLRWALYRGDQEVAGRFGLHAVRLDGSAPRSLTASLPAHADVEPDYALDSRSGRALFRADIAADGDLELLGVPVTGGAPASLSGPLVPGGDVLSFRTRDDWLAFRADRGKDEVFELFLTRVLGGPVWSLTPLVPRGDVEDDYRFDAAGTRIVYRADQRLNDVVELFAVSTPGTPALLSAPLIAGGDVTAFQCSPSSTRVVYRADQLVDGQYELFTLDAGPPVPLVASPAQAARNVEDDFRFSPDGALVVLRGDLALDERVELWRAPATGGAATRLNGNIVPAGGDVTAFRVSPDGLRVAYIADQTQNDAFALYSRPLDASAPAVRLSGLDVNAPVIELEVSPDSRHVAFVTQRLFGPHLRILHVAPLDGSAAAVAFPIAPFVLDPLGHGEFRFSPGGEFVATPDLDRAGVLFARVAAPASVFHFSGGGTGPGQFVLTRRELLMVGEIEVPGSALHGAGAAELFATPLALGRSPRLAVR